MFIVDAGELSLVTPSWKVVPKVRRICNKAAEEISGSGKVVLNVWLI